MRHGLEGAGRGMPVIILALDIATATGWAHTTAGSGTWMLHAKRDQSSSIRLLNLRLRMEKLIEEHGKPTLIAYESVKHSAGGNAMVVLSELQGVMKMVCEEHHIPYTGYTPTQVKKHATGKGNAQKQHMIDAACRKWRRPFGDEDENEVDALWLLDLVAKEMIPK